MRMVRPIADSKRYGFAVGRVRVLQTRLLTRGTFERLLDADSFPEQKRILSETMYGAYLESAQNADDVEMALDEAQKDLYAEFLERANLPKEIVRYFRTMHDFENVRAVLKAEALGIPVDEMLSDLGSVPAAAYRGEKALPKRMQKVLEQVREHVTDDDGEIALDMLDAVVDAEAAAAVLEIACDSKSKFMCDLAKIQIDLGNLKAFVRARLREMPLEEAERYFTDGGTVPVSVLTNGYRLPLEEVAKAIADRPGLRGVDPEVIIDPARLDLVVNAALASMFANASRVAIGPEPVLAYVATRKSEMTMLRTLLIGKIAGVDVEVLRARMKEVA